MSQLTAAQVKRWAKECGADLVGIASMDRFEGAPKQCDPRYISPRAKSMIVLGFRVLRGALRGIEEMPMVIWNLAARLEDAGFEAVPIPNTFPWTASHSAGHDPALTDQPRPDWSRPVSPDKPAPDVFVHLRIAAFAAGLGEIGYSKMLLTPEYGPRQRLGCIITDAELEPDPIIKPGTLCDRCMACVRECTGGCISKVRTVKIKVAGYDVEWGEIDMERCTRFFCGGSERHNPFMTSAEDKAGFNRPGYQAQGYKVNATYDYGRALEGSRGCTRACMVHLEEQGKLGNKFATPFRIKPQWRLEPIGAGATTGDGGREDLTIDD